MGIGQAVHVFPRENVLDDWRNVGRLAGNEP